MNTTRDMIEELIAEHYNDVEVQYALKQKSVTVAMAFIKKVRHDMYAPMGSEFEFAGDRPHE